MSIWRPVVECSEPAQLHDLQNRRFRESLKRIAATPFYRSRLFDTLADLDGLNLADLPQLPFTHKPDLVAQPPLALLAVPRHEVARIHAIASERPLLVALSRRDVMAWADTAARTFAAVGCRPGDVWYTATTWGRFTGGLGAQQGLELIGATVVPADSHQPHRVAALMREIIPTGIHCVPSYMLQLAAALQEQGFDPAALGLRYASLGGEPWHPEMRSRIEGVFNMKAFDVYGLAEFLGPGVAYECEAQAGLHISADHFLVEIVDPHTDRVLPPGETGEIVITSLTREAMPLLRFRTGDRSRLLTGTCPCGRTTPRLGHISSSESARRET